MYVMVAQLDLLMGLPTVGAGAVSDSFDWFWDSFHLSGLSFPAIIGGEAFSLTATIYMPCLVGIHWRLTIYRR